MRAEFVYEVVLWLSIFPTLQFEQRMTNCTRCYRCALAGWVKSVVAAALEQLTVLLYVRCIVN